MISYYIFNYRLWGHGNDLFAIDMPLSFNIKSCYCMKVKKLLILIPRGTLGDCQGKELDHFGGGGHLTVSTWMQFKANNMFNFVTLC